jgi:thiol-disulfide isomerase/thioredoxin
MIARLLLTLLTICALAACGQPAKKEAQPARQAEAAAPGVPVKGVDRSHKGTPAPGAGFNDPDGGEISMAEFKGVPVLVNLWASWCAPCVKELPTLDKLARTHRDDGQLGVIAISEDSGPHPSVVAFLDKLKIQDLGAYQDPEMALSGALHAEVMPTSILYDANGKEVWRYVGDLDWTSPEVSRLLAEAGPAKAGSLDGRQSLRGPRRSAPSQ